MSATTAAWKDDWRSRIYSNLERLGHQGLLDYLRKNPGKSDLAIAEELGPDVVSIQIIPLVFEEARSSGQLRWAAKDWLVRKIREVFRIGWGNVYVPPANSLFTEEMRQRLLNRSVEEQLRFQKADVFGGWIRDVLHVPANIESRLDAVAKALERLSPPVGWLPEGPDDPFIVAAFNEAWPESAVIEYLPVGPHQLCPKCKAVLAEPTETDLDQTCPHCGTKFPLP